MKIAARSADVEFRSVTRRFGPVVAVDAISFRIDSGNRIFQIDDSGQRRFHHDVRNTGLVVPPNRV